MLKNSISMQLAFRRNIAFFAKSNVRPVFRVQQSSLISQIGVRSFAKKNDDPDTPISDLELFEE